MTCRPRGADLFQVTFRPLTRAAELLQQMHLVPQNRRIGHRNPEPPHLLPTSFR